MTAELVSTDLRWDQELAVPIDSGGRPALYAQAERGRAVIAAYTSDPPQGPIEWLTVRALVTSTPAYDFLAVDPDPRFDGGGAVEIAPGDPDPLSIEPTAPGSDDLRRASIRLVLPGAGRIRELALLHRGVGVDGRAFVAVSGSRSWWIVVAGEIGAATLAPRIRATFGHAPHPGISVTDESDLPASVRRRMARL